MPVAVERDRDRCVAQVGAQRLGIQSGGDADARAQELKRSFRKDELARIDRDEARSQERLTGLEAEARELPVPSGSARRELAVADRVLAERRKLAVTAARISPPPYITKELGERPADPNKRWHWDRGVADIEHYRQRNGVKDRSRAFGPESKGSAERAGKSRRGGNSWRPSVSSVLGNTRRRHARSDAGLDSSDSASTPIFGD